MATVTKFNSFTEAIAEKVHNLGSDQLMLALSNTLPVVGNTQLSNITEITYTFLSSRVLTQASSAQTGGVYKLVLNDITLTASGGSVGPFRYVILYNNTATNKELIGWVDHGSSISLANTDSYIIDFDNTNGVLTFT